MEPEKTKGSTWNVDQNKSNEPVVAAPEALASNNAQSYSQAQAQQALQSKKLIFLDKRSIIVASIGITVMCLLAIAAVIYNFSKNSNYVNKDNSTSSINEKVEELASDHNISNLSEEETQALKNLKTTFYKPSTNIHSVVLTNNAIPDKNELLTYGLGQDNAPITNRVSVTQFSKPSTFNPPSDCGPYYPDGSKTIDKLPCRQVVKKEKYTGYAYEGRSPGIDIVGPSESGGIISKLTLYAEMGSTVIVIQGIGVSSDTLIGYMDAMAPMKFSDYPKDSIVNISDESR